MKRIILTYLLLTTGLFSQDIYKTEYKLIHQFNNIAFQNAEARGSNGVDDMNIDSSGNFVFTDEATSRILFINSDFEIEKTLDYNNPFQYDEKFFYLSDKYILMGFYGGYLYSLDGKISELSIPYEYITYRKYQIIEDMIIGEKDGIYYSYQIPETMDDEVIFRSENETFDYLKTRKGFKIDGDFILYNGRLVTTIGETFIEYYHSNNPGDEYSNTTACYLRGIDKDGNYYFGNRKWTYIYDVEGNLFQVVRAKILSPFTFPKIDPDGNIYYCHLNEDNGTIDLYKIDRAW